MLNLGAVRLALGLGDQELEQRLRPALEIDDQLEIAAYCLGADQVLEAAHSREVDVVLVAWGLHRLTDAVLAELERSPLPLVVLVPEPEDDRWRTAHAVALPMDVDATTLRDAIHSALRGERPRLARAQHSARDRIRSDQPQPEPAEPPPLSVIAVTGGAGSPGRTTVAINLATALGAVAPTVLVDLDFASPAVAAYLDRDPSRNLCTLAYAARESPHAWARAIEDELQLLHPRSPSGVVLCGLPKREMRASVPPNVLERIIGELAHRFRYVVLDLGAELLGADPVATAHRTGLTAAQHVLLVTASDLVGLWHARTALGQLERLVDSTRPPTSLVINRHHPRHHHARAEIEWHLGRPAAAVIPHDYGAAQRAVSEQAPLVVHGGGRAARAMLDLAERVHRGRVRLPAPADEPSDRHALARAFGPVRSLVSRMSVSDGRASSSPVPVARGRGEAW